MPGLVPTRNTIPPALGNKWANGVSGRRLISGWKPLLIDRCCQSQQIPPLLTLLSWRGGGEMVLRVPLSF